MIWRAWVADGRVFGSAEHPWGRVPSGVVGVVEYGEPPYRTVHHNHDWIWLDEDGFHRVPMHPALGFWSPAPHGVLAGALKRGENLPDGEWEAIQAAMFDAREAP